MAEIDYLGKQTMGVVLPTGLTACLSALATLEAQLPGIALKASASVGIDAPVLITDLIDNLNRLIQAIAALLASGVTILPPAFNANLGVELDLQGAAIQASIALQASLAALYGTPGFYAWYYNGACNQFAGALGGEVGGGLPDVGLPDQEIASLIMVCSEGPAIAALKGLTGL